jgi:bifunctional DNA primase/polymerase-like protein
VIPTTRRLATAAVTYAAHGWPIARLAIPRDGRCPCGSGCEAMHLLDDQPITTASQAEQAWGEHGYGIAFITSRFDVLDMPGYHGAPLHHTLKTRCPTATARPGRRYDVILEPGPVRWHFYLQPGTVRTDRADRADGILHTGPDDWVVSPPSRTPATGRVEWIVPPMQVKWRPYARTDIFDTLGLV